MIMANKKLMEDSFKGKSSTSKKMNSGVAKPDMSIPNKKSPPGNAANSANPANPGNLNVLKKVKASPGFKTDS